MRDLPAALGIPTALPALGRRALRGYLWFGVAGLLLLALGASPDVPAVRWAVLALLAGWVAAPALGRLRRPARAGPADGREVVARQVRLYAAVVAGFGATFVVWARSLGVAWPVAVGALLLLDAAANAVAALTDWWRLSMLGHAAGLAACGFALPFVGEGHWAVALGGGLVTGSLVSAGILYCQVRHHEAGALRGRAPHDPAGPGGQGP